MTAAWQAGHTYVPGSLVRPASVPPVTQTQAINGYFEEGATGWDLTGPIVIQGTGGYGSAGCCAINSAYSGTGVALNQAKFAVIPGRALTAECMIQQGASDVDHTRGFVQIYWYAADDTQIGQPSNGNVVNDGRGGAWHKSSVSAVAPGGAAYARAAINLYQNSADPVWGDNLIVGSVYQAPTGLVYKAVQPAPGKSASSEPTWPPVLGQQVIDNEVIWEAVLATRITWVASPIMRSGATEPTWPLDPGAMVHDGDMDWVAVSSQITDPNCPHSKVVAIMASKVFAADKDIVRFSATVNPLDWTLAQDAGYLPSGLQQANSNDMAVLAPYRSNLTAFNTSSFQNWQVDPDPSAMALLDQMDGIGSSWQHAAQPVGNDLFYLSQLGVRTVGVAAGAESLQAGDVGMPIDPLVQPAIAADNTTLGPRATYYPSAGQYWLAVGGPSPQVFVCTMNGGKPKWGRYLFPFAVDAFAQLGNDLFIRHGDEVCIVSEDVATDDVAGVATDFGGTVQFSWLDFGQPGVTKMVEGFDIVATGNPSVSIGYDQSNPSAFTDPYAVSPDTVPGGIIPLPVAAPALSVRVDFAGGTPWSLQAFQLYLDDMRGQP